MKKGKKSEHSAEQKRAERIYSRIIKGLVIAGIALFFIHWGYSLGVVCFILGLLISMSKDVWNGYVMNTNRMVIQHKDYTECIEVGEFLLFY